MKTQKEYLFDRRKVEVQQCMELKRTNSLIAFLCPCHHLSIRVLTRVTR